MFGTHGPLSLWKRADVFDHSLPPRDTLTRVFTDIFSKYDEMYNGEAMSVVNEGSARTAGRRDALEGDTVEAIGFDDYEQDNNSNSMRSEYSFDNLPKNPREVIHFDNSDSEESMSILHSDQHDEDDDDDDEDYGDEGDTPGAGQSQRHLPSWRVTKWKTRLSRSGSDADKHLCAALNLERVTEGSDDYRVLDYNGREIVQALRIVLGDLLDIGTILRVAELYVPELLMQLPYTKKLNLPIAVSVKSAIESRDVWFVKEHGDESYLEHNEPPFAYLGNLAHGLHSSIEGTLTRGHARPIAQAPRGPDGEFDPWCDSLWVFNEDQDGVGIDDALRVSIEYDDEQQEIFVNLDDCAEPQPPRERARTPAPKGSPSPDLYSQTREDETAPAPPEQPDAIGCRPICKGLLVENVDKLGFREGHGFLTLSRSHNALNVARRVPAPVAVKTPCMANIASTVYAKRSRDRVDVSRCLNSHPTLIKALWVLFMHSKTSPVAATAASGAAAEAAEPSTPEALAVMVHLAVKCFNLETDTSLGVCNDIKGMYDGRCHRETEFLPVAAIVGGLFGLNVELTVDGCNYYIVNVHYGELWAPGSVCYNNGVWFVMVEGLNVPVQIPREESTLGCYHAGTLGAYVRLNNLKVGRVPADGYCGFHTVAVLLGVIGGDGACDHDVRKTLVCKTANYMIRESNTNDNDNGIRVYLEMNEINTPEGLTDLLMQHNRWLYVDEVGFMLKAHDKLPAALTENSYPVYNPDYTHFLCVSHHYEPVMRV